MMDSCQRETSNQSGGLPECVMEYMTAVNQSILVIDPIRTPKLCEALGTTDPDAEFLPGEDENMDSEEGMRATAVAIVEQLQGAPHAEACATVMMHLKSTMKGGGKGKARFTSRYQA